MSPRRKTNTPNSLFSKRLEILIGNKKNLDFEADCTLSHGSIRAYFKGSEPKLTALQSIILATGCNADWLITGRGEPFPDKNK
jgi:hypothetical protein